MTTTMKVKATIVTFFALLAVVFTGCKTSVAIDPQSGQDQTATYQAGYFRGPVDGQAASVFRTAIREIDDLGYYRTGELHKETSITIYARKVGDEKVTIRLKQLAEGQTEIRIRVGKLGNLAESQTIYAAIRDAL